MMDCRTNGDVVMNAYNANDCGGAPISSTILALSATCYAYSYSLSDTVRKNTNYSITHSLSPISSTILALTATFFLWPPSSSSHPPFARVSPVPSISLSQVTDTTSTTSVVFSCGQPNLEGATPH